MDSRAAAEYYLSRGWAPVPIPPAQKGPKIKGWTTARFDPDDFDPHGNIGLRLGPSAGGLVDVDLDCPEAVALADAFLPPTLTFGRESTQYASHRIYLCPGIDDNRHTKRLSSAQVELHSERRQTLSPPSVHPSGEIVAFRPDTPDVASISPDELVVRVFELAMAVHLHRLLPVWQERRCTHDAVLALAGALRGDGWSLERATSLIERAVGLDEPHRAAAVRDTYSADTFTGWASLGSLAPDHASTGGLQLIASRRKELGLSPKTKTKVDGYDPDDMAMATAFADDHADAVRYVPGLGWHCWTGSQWTERLPLDEVAATSRRVAAMFPDDSPLRDWANGYRNARQYKPLLETAAVGALRADPDDLDAQLGLINVANGMVDLRTGELYPHDQQRLFSLTAPTPYTPSACAPRFARFLFEVMGNDAAKVDYLIRWLGYCLTGYTTEQALTIWHGPRGNNGKSVLIHVLQHVLGPWVTTLSSDALLRRHYKDQSAFACLRGVRVAIVPEVSAGSWDDTAVKALTAGDAIRVRRLYRESIEIKTHAKIINTCNTLPTIRDNSPAFRRRLQILPWLESFDGREDRGLVDALKAEAPGILRILVDGSRAWHEDGLHVPAAVASQVEEYTAGEDMVRSWIEERTVHDENAVELAAPLYQDFRAWVEDSGESWRGMPSKRTFNSRLREAGYESGKWRDGQLCFRGFQVIKRW